MELRNVTVSKAAMDVLRGLAPLNPIIADSRRPCKTFKKLLRDVSKSPRATLETRLQLEHELLKIF